MIAKPCQPLKNKKSFGIELFDRNKEANLREIQRELEDGSYRTGEYEVFKIFTPKEREIARLKYEHRVVHHAVMNIMEPIWVKIFTRDTYSCIKNRGIHSLL